jgi:hypothetical protein
MSFIDVVKEVFMLFIEVFMLFIEVFMLFMAERRAVRSWLLDSFGFGGVVVVVSSDILEKLSVRSAIYSTTKV